jgi:hypothetical protein
MSSGVSDELQSLRDSYPCPGIAIRATRRTARYCLGSFADPLSRRPRFTAKHVLLTFAEIDANVPRRAYRNGEMTRDALAVRLALREPQ